MVHGQFFPPDQRTAVMADPLLDLFVPPMGPPQATRLFLFPPNIRRVDSFYLKGHHGKRLDLPCGLLRPGRFHYIFYDITGTQGHNLYRFAKTSLECVYLLNFSLNCMKLIQFGCKKSMELHV